jgi:hypothetical protein
LPDEDDVTCQLYFTPKGQFDIDPENLNAYMPPVYIRFPKGTTVAVHDVVEVDAGTGYYYRVRFVERVHKNFINEYLVAICQQGLTNPVPPPSGASLLAEDGSYLLLEDGSYILLE